MQNRRMLRRVRLYLIDWLVIVIFLTVWMIARKPGSTERTIPYIKTPGHILVQLAKLPELTGAEKHNVPMWTLYGDGTLIFRVDPSDSLWRTQLSFQEIQRILDVIINQNTFFEHTTQQYANVTAGKDNDKLLLTVNANGQQKEVLLIGQATNQGTVDIQTTHVFAIEQFLLGYHPSQSVFYAPNSDSNSDTDDGP